MERVLDVMIVTHGAEGLEMVEKMCLPRVDGVVYVVSWQSSGNQAIPQALERPDIKIFVTDSIGSSANRNNAMAHTEAPLCLVSDNDLKYTSEQLQSVIDTFAAHPEVDVASFMYSGPDNKRYPSHECDISRRLPKYFSSTCFEIAFRRDKVVGRVSYNLNFGVNAPLAAAEDEVFLHDCRKAGLNCRFFPIVITHHASLTTGMRAPTPATLMAAGAYLRMEYPFTAPLRIPLLALRRHRAKQARFFQALWWLLQGFFYYLK